MPILDGMGVNAENTNRELLDAMGDDVAEGVLGLQNILALSGPFIANIQRAMNASASFQGSSTLGVYNLLPVWVSNDAGGSSNNLQARAEALSVKFNLSTGHAHSGAAGDGALISGPNIINVPLKGRFIQAVDLTAASGFTTNVSVQFATSIPSTNPSIRGVVVSNPQNKVILRYATGASTDDQILDSLGNSVYGRLTHSAGVWTLTYFVYLSGVETAYSLPSTNVRWYYQRLYAPLEDEPVYSELASIPSENATADVIDASATDRGVVTTGTQSFSGAKTHLGSLTLDNNLHLNEFNDTASAGAALAHPGKSVIRLSNVGLTTLETITSPTRGKTLVVINDTGAAITVKNDIGAVTANRIFTGTGQELSLKAGASILLVYEVNSLRWRIIGGSGSNLVGAQEALGGLINGVNATFGPLSSTPANSDSVLVMVDGQIIDKIGWVLSGLSIVFNAGHIPATAQTVYVFYLTSGAAAPAAAPTGTQYVPYYTLTALEISAKAVTLPSTPASPAKVLLDIISGSAQEFNVDFTVLGSTLTWSGYALDGVLAAGDKLRINYFS